MFLGMYFEIFPEIRQWHFRIKDKLRSDRTLRNLFGYPRYFEGPLSDELFRDAFSWIPQSTIGCITNDAIVEMQYYIESERLRDWDILNNKHDSMLMQIPESKDDVEHCSKKMGEFLGPTLKSPLDGWEFTMGVEVSTGKNWAKYDKDKNPEGMREL